MRRERGPVVKRPSHAKIGLIKWAIVFGELEEEDWGECNPNTRVISIDSRMDLGTQKATLMHECIHAMWVSFGWPTGGMINEEALACQMEMALTLFIMDNPEIIKWIQG